MGVTRMHYLDEVNTNDEVIPSDEEINHHWRRKENHSMKPASNLSSYKTSKTDRWEPIKSPIIGLENVTKKGINTPMASNQNHIYKALTLAAEGTDTDTLRKYPLLF